MVGISLLSVVFPALILTEFGNIVTDLYDKFEFGNNALLLILSNVIILSLGFLYKKNKFVNFSSVIKNFLIFSILPRLLFIFSISCLI